ncbi:MAG: serine dehydratase [Sandaracinus sp.]|nr:serine dehydratase [Sandaracinus sp.]|tara:strand:+ start:1903 stop:2853 length:951 start_codon:yes stop_codon:yes gene_type:complete
MPSAPTTADLQEARSRIAGKVHRTPLMASAALSDAAGATVLLKCENLQRAGAFKARGATNAVFALTDAEAARGVCTHSSGNHGQALALAARTRGIPCSVVMPDDAPAVKRAAVLGYGADVVPCAPTLAARESTLAEVAERTGATFVHPYEDPRVIAGQATAAAEVLDEADVDLILTPVGGGGLFAGTSLACRAFAPRVEVLGAEPAAVDDAARSLASGERAEAPAGITVADGLRTRLGALPFAILRDHARTIVTVDEASIVSAMRFVWERTKLIIEPSSAVPVAAALGGAVRGRGRVAIVLSGGNVDLDHLPFGKS